MGKKGERLAKRLVPKVVFPSERMFQRLLRNEWRQLGNWSQDTVAGHGAVDGLPDVLFLRGGLIIPVELKAGAMLPDGKTLVCHEIRPSQRRWASKFRHHGGKCGLAVGIHSRGKPDGWDWYGWRYFLIHPDAWLSNLKGTLKVSHRFTPDQYTEFKHLDQMLKAIIGD